MARGKYLRSKPTAKKSVAMILALILAFGGVVGGTVAWLIASPDPLVNTFTYGDIDITLTETDTALDEDNDPNTNDYKMLPGEEIIKDPKVTVMAESESNWLFVKLEKSENFDSFMEYEMAVDTEGNAIWTELTGVEGVYFRAVQAEEVESENIVFHVLKDDIVKVKESVTKEMLNALDPEGQPATYPTLTVSAYAVQYSGFEPEVTAPATEPTDEQIQAAAALAWEEAVKATTPAPAP